MKENLMSPVATIWDIEKKCQIAKTIMSKLFTDEVFNIEMPFENKVSPNYSLIVTGSSLFPLHGIDLQRPIDDIDIVVVCSSAKKMKEKFINLCELFPERMHRTSEYFDDSFYYITPMVKINFAVKEGYDCECFNIGNTAYSSLESVIEWKLRIHREKDIEDLKKLADITEYLRKSCKVGITTIFKLKMLIANPEKFCEDIDKVQAKMRKAEAERLLLF